MTFARMLVFGIVALMLAAGAAHAETVLVDKSEIGFTMKQMGVNFDGRFQKWKADVDFQPKALSRSKAHVEIDLSSVYLASVESEDEARGPQWFNTAKFPVARFTSTSIKDLGGDRYEIAGKLSLKGMTRDLTVPISVKTDSGGNRVAEGTFSVKRLDYKLGEGEWADPSTVADDVLVRVRFVLRPAV
jgi:polyisoprenoid-binding protein YceI